MQTSYGQYLLRENLKNLVRGTPLENVRPDWLLGMELDFFYEKHGLAFEFQGDQHFLPVWGGANLSAQQARDAAKRRICKERGVVLVKVQAWELAKLKLKGKLMSALNWYRPLKARKERMAWYRSVVTRHKPKRARHELKAIGQEYCKKIKALGGTTAISPHHSKKRLELRKAAWGY